MRNRTTILCLLACMFALLSALAANRQTSACMDRYGEDADTFLSFSFANDGSCLVEQSSTPLQQLLLVLTLGCTGAAFISAGKVLRDRQQDRALLQGAAFLWARQHSR